MPSLQIMDSSLSFSQSQTRAQPNFSCRGAHCLILVNARRSLTPFGKRRLSKVSCKLQETDNQYNGEERPESLFMKELRRRGMTPTSLLEEANRGISKDEDRKTAAEDRGFSQRNSVAPDSGMNMFNQREQSMTLNSEGLEGLIPRAKLLLRLGGTFFLAFWPLILTTVASFTALYLYFGPAFIHDANSRRDTPPQYIDPYELLEEERISRVAPTLN